MLLMEIPNIMLTFCTIAAAVIGLVTSVLAIARSDRQKSVYFNLLSIAVTFYLVGNFIEFYSPSLEGGTAGIKVAYLGIPFIPGLWFLCVCEYCGVKSFSPRVVFAFMAVPVIIMVLAFTWESNHLLFISFEYLSGNQVSQLAFVEGPLYDLKQAYLHIFNFLGISVIIVKFIKGTPRFRKQALLFLFSALVPAFSTFTWTINIQDNWIDLTPLGLSVAMALFYLGLEKFGVKNIAESLRDYIVDNLHEGIALFDHQGIYLESNRSFKELFPLISVAPLGLAIDDMNYLPFNLSSLEGSKRGEVLKEFSIDHNGYIRTYRISVSPIERGNKILGYSTVLYNITALKNIMSTLEEKIYIDSLTQIYNRAFLFEKGNHELRQALLTGNGLTVAMFDVDHFKKVNDNYGHDFGDYVLSTIAHIVSVNLRKSDTFARYGGEEFCILFPGTELPEAIIKAEKLRKKLASHVFEKNNVRISVTASFGISVLNHDDQTETLERILKRADEKLYEAKKTGRNKVVG